MQSTQLQTEAAPVMATCGVCFGILQDPVTLECGDSFCMSCIRSHLERHQHTTDVAFLCFLCLQPNRSVHLNTIAEFRNAPLAARIREIGHGKEDIAVCDWCEEAHASQYCASCGYSLCMECNVAVHKNSLKRSHTTVPITDGRRPLHQYRKCPQRGHEDHRAEFFCVKCQVSCCVYCLQVGSHRGHDNITLSDAAADVRHQLARQVDEVVQVKTRLDNVVQELNRVTQIYEESYDIVEQQLSDRFALYQQQILKKEAEARELLQQLRLSGDRTIADCRRETLQNVNRVNEAVLRGRRLQSIGSDMELLDNRTTLNVFHRMEVPVLAGTGFRFADPGDLNLSSLSLAMDVRSMIPTSTVGSNALSGGGGSSSSSGSALNTGPLAGFGTTNNVASSMMSTGRRKQSLSFPQDSEIDTRTLPDGVSFRCVDTATSLQVGIRSIEHFVDGVNTWKVRLDRFPDGALGIMCAGGTNEVILGEGFFWRPGRQTFEGRLGSPTDLILKHPATRAGDILKFTFDADRRQLRVAHNGVERGPLLTNIQGYVSPCFMFNPGECITLLQ